MTFGITTAASAAVPEQAIVTVLQRKAAEANSEATLLVQHDGNKVWVPAGTVTVETPYTAIGAYSATKSDELSFEDGAQLAMLRVHGPWFYGCDRTGAAGLFPGNYVTPAPPAVVPEAPPPAPPKKKKPTDLRASRFERPNPMMVSAPAPAPAPTPPKLRAKPRPPPPASTLAPAPVPAPAPGPSTEKAAPPAATPFVFTLWAHNMGRVGAGAALLLGPLTWLWADGREWDCRLDGETIYPGLLTNATTAECGAPACCNPRTAHVASLHGSRPVGLFCIGAGVLLLALEAYPKGYGLYRPATGAAFRRRVSVLAFAHGAAALPMLSALPSVLAGVFLLAAAIGHAVGALRNEAGDGGRSRPPRQQVRSTPPAPPYSDPQPRSPPPLPPPPGQSQDPLFRGRPRRHVKTAARRGQACHVRLDRHLLRHQRGHLLLDAERVVRHRRKPPRRPPLRHNRSRRRRGRQLRQGVRFQSPRGRARRHQLLGAVG